MGSGLTDNFMCIIPLLRCFYLTYGLQICVLKSDIYTVGFPFVKWKGCMIPLIIMLRNYYVYIFKFPVGEICQGRRDGIRFMTNLKMNGQLERLEAYHSEVYMLLQIVVGKVFISTKVPRIFGPDFNKQSVVANCFSIEMWTHSLHRQPRGTIEEEKWMNLKIPIYII